MKWAMNQSFIRGLREKYKRGEMFHIKMAYEYYRVHHAQDKKLLMDDFTCMSARNSLAMAIQSGLIWRPARGWYQRCEPDIYALAAKATKKPSTTAHIVVREIVYMNPVIRIYSAHCVRCRVGLDSTNRAPGAKRHCIKCWVAPIGEALTPVAPKPTIDQGVARDRFQLIEIE